MWYFKLHTLLLSMLKDKRGANAVEYALIMALVAVFIIAAVILMATEIGQRKKRLGPESPGKHGLGIGVGHAHLITSSPTPCRLTNGLKLVTAAAPLLAI